MVPVGYGPLVSKALKRGLKPPETHKTHLTFAEPRVLWSGLELAFYGSDNEEQYAAPRYKTLSIGFNASWLNVKTALRELEAWGKANAVPTDAFHEDNTETPGFTWHPYAYSKGDQIALNLHIHPRMEMVFVPVTFNAAPGIVERRGTTR